MIRFVENSPAESAAGLCATCTHARRIESSRGSLFFLCQLSASDARFAKYPPLPVVSCTGHSPTTAPAGSNSPLA
jgi:hypothetical protein